MIPLVSIVTPVYNAEKYIGQTISSVQAQTFSSWELILINDGSTDNSAHLISEFLNDVRISLVNKPNGGVCSARNLGIEKTRGTYIAFLDADDIWLEQNLEKKISVLESENIDFVFSDMYEADEAISKITLASVGKDEHFLENLLMWNGEVIPGPASNIIVHRKCFDSGLRFDSKFSTAADLDLTIYLASSYKGKRIPEPLWIYRIIGNSMSRNVAVMEKDVLGVFDKAKENNLFPTNTFKRKCFSSIYYMIGASWWINGNSKLKGVFYIAKSLLEYPPSFFRLVSKLTSKI